MFINLIRMHVQTNSSVGNQQVTIKSKYFSFLSLCSLSSLHRQFPRSLLRA